MKLNLGAGDKILKGYVNHDITRHRQEIDEGHDLDVLPWPWADGQFSEVRSWAVFEHLHLTLAQSIDECWRILEPGGLLVVKVPDVDADTVADDPTHIWRGWTEKTFEFFDPGKGTYGLRGKMYGFKPWRLKSVTSTAKGNAWVVRMEKLEDSSHQ